MSPNAIEYKANKKQDDWPFGENASSHRRDAKENGTNEEEYYR